MVVDPVTVNFMYTLHISFNYIFTAKTILPAILERTQVARWSASCGSFYAANLYVFCMNLI